MRKNIYNIIAIVTLLSSVLFLIEGCKLKNPVEGVGITIKANAVGAPNIFRIVDAATGYSDPAFENAIVKIGGEDADVIYTADGLKTVKIIEGQFGLSIRNGIKVSSDNPVNFNITISIPGFNEVFMPYQITNTTPSTNTISLLNLMKLPSGASKADTFSIANSAGEFTDSFQVNIPNPVSGSEASITFAPGAKFMDENGNPLSGKINVNVIYVEPKTADEFAVFPGNLSGMVIEDVNRSNPKTYMVNPSAWISVSFSNNGKTYKKPPSFSVSAPRIGGNGFPGSGSNFVSPRGGGGGAGGAGYNPFMFNTGGTLGGTSPAGGLPGGSSFANAQLNQTQTVSIELRNNKEDFGNYEFHTILRSTSPGNAEIARTRISFPTSTTVLSAQAPSALVTTSELVVEIKNKSTKVVTTRTYNSSDGNRLFIDLPTIPKEYFFEVRFALTCPDGNRVVLDPGYIVYLIEEDLYQVTLRSVDGRKIFPQDNAIGGVKWDQFLTGQQITENGKVYSTLRIPIGALKANTKYRASVVWGNKGRVDNDQSQPLMTPPAFPTGQDFIQVMDMSATSCD